MDAEERREDSAPEVKGDEPTNGATEPEAVPHPASDEWVGQAPVPREPARAASTSMAAPPPPPSGPPTDIGVPSGGFPGRQDPADRLMSYGQHLEEVRDRLVKSVVGLVIMVAISFLFTDYVFEILKSRAEGVTLIRTGVAEMVGTYVKVAFISGAVLSTPLWLYQIVMFVAPGLKPPERRFLRFALPAVLASFILGVLFAFYVLLPPALNFLLHFKEDLVVPLIRVGDYVGVVTALLFWIGLIFETPLILFVLARIGLVTPDKLKHFRPYAIAGAFVLAAIITPTVDPVNQTIVAVPIILLYEVGILLSHLAVKARGESG